MASKLQQKKSVRKHYGLDREVTDEELAEEIANLERRRDKGTLNDDQELLAAALDVI